MTSAATPIPTGDALSPWWRHTVILIIVLGLSVLLWLAAKTYRDAPPIPDKVVGPSGQLVFTGADIMAGQEVFLRYGLMENGTIWGHGAYLGPDFSAEYLHTLATDIRAALAQQRYRAGVSALGGSEREEIDADTAALLQENRYDPTTKALALTARGDGLLPAAGRQVDAILSRSHASVRACRATSSATRRSCSSSPRSSPGPRGHRWRGARASPTRTPTTSPMIPAPATRRAVRRCCGAPSA